ncbi:uncharacterized protein F5Z01DRAFT_240901 [Emericellopsis atlantica]|uniref:Uncharacterized protein n=1 Tax=Emericellopsis atlantica TaxID=2614577 RepID=A0A9P8CP14_9HYPO|nr:uncharacterized protein F5Z01DRAFT_240901 [Emericellopsis atlantica]KAG9252301.1 hypothetical protein F5Z01DRAFT_240901 [Emericellopsis atlantica]
MGPLPGPLWQRTSKRLDTSSSMTSSMLSVFWYHAGQSSKHWASRLQDGLQLVLDINIQAAKADKKTARATLVRDIHVQCRKSWIGGLPRPRISPGLSQQFQAGKVISSQAPLHTRSIQYYHYSALLSNQTRTMFSFFLPTLAIALCHAVIKTLNRTLNETLKLPLFTRHKASPFTTSSIKTLQQQHFHSANEFRSIYHKQPQSITTYHRQPDTMTPNQAPKKVGDLTLEELEGFLLKLVPRIAEETNNMRPKIYNLLWVLRACGFSHQATLNIASAGHHILWFLA